jgi:TRAP transporter TAXI family solute receptor
MPITKLFSREFLSVALPVLALVAAAFVLAYQFVEPAPPRRITMTTGSEQGAYHAFGKQYAAVLAKSGITLDLKPSAGSIENIKRLSDETSGVSVGLVQGGLATAETAPSLTSLGRTFLEPLWVFQRAANKADRLSALAGKKIAVGLEGSGTRPLATSILASSGVTAQSSTWVGLAAKASADALRAGEVDAIFLSMSPQSDLVQSLLRDPSIALFDFKQAEALSRLFPYLAKVMLPSGVMDLGANIPADDVTLVAPGAALVVRKDLHPALIGLLVGAAKEIHSGAGLFQKPGEYPIALDTELPLDADAARYYKNGAPFLQRYLPFWLAVFLERMTVMIVPIATILLPLFKIVPMAYQWRVKRRILYWYDKLKVLERQIAADRSPARVPGFQAEIARIEDAVSVIPIPLAFSDQLYGLRSAVELVRQRVGAIAVARVEPAGLPEHAYTLAAQ